MAIGGTGGTGGAGGAGGASGAGGFDNGGGTGAVNPQAGIGGIGGGAGMAAGGVGGTAGTGNPGGMGGTGGAIGGAGGAGGFSGTGGMAGASGDPDAGMDPEAPVLECEQGRDTVMLLPAAFAAPAPICTAQLPSDALLAAEMMAVAVTVIEQGAAVETMWPGRKSQGDECGSDDAFYVNNALGSPQVTLCPALCEALVEVGIEGFKVELIYGCDPPE